MTEPTFQLDEESPAKKPNPAKRAIAYGFAVVLLVACAVVAFRGTGDQWGHIRQANPWDAAAMLALVVASILLNGWVLWVMTKPFERGSPVRLAEMTALVGATCLLNFAMRAGMISRAAYLKKRHGITYRGSVMMMLMLGGLTVIIYVTLGGVTLWRGGIDGVWFAAVAAVFAATALAVTPVMRIAARRFPGVTTWFETAHRSTPVWVFVLLSARAVDLGFSALRLVLAGRVFGTPVAFHTGLVMSAGGMLVTLATPLPNGLGAREGLYALMAQLGVAGDSLTGASKGSAVALIDRAAESAMFVVSGLVSLGWLHRHAGKQAGRDEKSA
jgi:hypothetical protein